ncbi:hypothetical protein [Phytoactinopolyspora endophytica]|uniref:hypothetical protein n=1 Tax=Phytoactinopolyspora endophytica TaxID=1642495 RepID=UPI00101D8B3A|nr:hypothetical protein [Phytoactinopolyspora endophytica]
MSDGLHGANIITVAGAALLLTGTRCGQAVHATGECTGLERGRPALDDFILDEPFEVPAPTLQNYDREALLAPRWEDTTLCGYLWEFMFPGEGGPLFEDEQPAYAPTRAGSASPR